MSEQKTTEKRLIRVSPQPEYIESSGRWSWPLPERAQFNDCCTTVVTASREWWEYAPSEAKPHPHAEGVMLRDEVWYWAVPDEDSAVMRAKFQNLHARLKDVLSELEKTL